MPRLKKPSPEQAEERVRVLFDAIEKRSGRIINIFQGLGNSHVALESYLTLDRLISEGTLTTQEQQIVRLVVSQFNDCNYCIAAHTQGARKSGLPEEDIVAIRRGEPANPKQSALVKFTLQVLRMKGFVTDEELQAFFTSGYNDEQVCEVVTIIAQKTLSNYFNHINDTELDLPPAPEL